ncbi:MAG: hypothetical protein WC570_03285 [Patescibacteria group bacterium]
MKINVLIQFTFLLLLIGQLLFGHEVMAQEVTKQRTTGTYLPVLAQDKFSQQFDVNQGGSVYLDDGGVEVVIPDNFYNQKITFSVRRVKWQDNTAIPSLKIDSENFVGQDVFEITAVDPETNLPVLQFDKNFKIIFRYFDSEVAGFDEEKVKIRYFDRSALEWKEITSQANLDSNSIEVYVNHLSLFAMTAEAQNQPAKSKEPTTGTNTGIPTWAKVLLVIGLLIISGIGGWFVYTTYKQTRAELELENNMSIAGGNRENDKIGSAKAISPANNINQQNTQVAPDTKKSDNNQPPDSNNEIWIDF